MKLAVGAGRQSHRPVEGSREMGLTGEAGPERDGENRFARLGERFTRSLEAQAP